MELDQLAYILSNPDGAACSTTELRYAARTTHRMVDEWVDYRGGEAHFLALAIHALACDPALPTPRSIITGLRRLSRYACGIADARDARIAGRIADAVQYEAQCERIYSSLPEWARW